MTAVAVGIIVGMVGLVVLAVTMADINGNLSNYLFAGAVAFAALGVVELLELRRKHRHR